MIGIGAKTANDFTLQEFTFLLAMIQNSRGF